MDAENRSPDQPAAAAASVAEKLRQLAVDSETPTPTNDDVASPVNTAVGAEAAAVADEMAADVAAADVPEADEEEDTHALEQTASDVPPHPAGEVAVPEAEAERRRAEHHAEAEPHLAAARVALSQLSKQAVSEIRHLKSPPEVVRVTVGCCYTLLAASRAAENLRTEVVKAEEEGEDMNAVSLVPVVLPEPDGTEWGELLKMLLKPHFLESLRGLDIGSLPLLAIELVRPLVSDEARIMKQSQSAASVARWVAAVVDCYDAASELDEQAADAREILYAGRFTTNTELERARANRRSNSRSGSVSPGRRHVDPISGMDQLSRAGAHELYSSAIVPTTEAEISQRLAELAGDNAALRAMVKRLSTPATSASHRDTGDCFSASGTAAPGAPGTPGGSRSVSVTGFSPGAGSPSAGSGVAPASLAPRALRQQIDKMIDELRIEREARRRAEERLVELRQERDHAVVGKELETRRAAEVSRLARIELDELRLRLKNAELAVKHVRGDNQALRDSLNRAGYDRDGHVVPRRPAGGNAQQKSLLRSLTPARTGAGISNRSGSAGASSRSASRSTSALMIAGGASPMGASALKKSASRFGGNNFSASRNIHGRGAAATGVSQTYPVGSVATWRGMQATVRYIGPVQCLGPANWYGIELVGASAGRGEHSGVLGGIFYFDVLAANSGIFCRASELGPGRPGVGGQPGLRAVDPAAVTSSVAKIRTGTFGSASNRSAANRVVGGQHCSTASAITHRSNSPRTGSEPLTPNRSAKTYSPRAGSAVVGSAVRSRSPPTSVGQPRGAFPPPPRHHVEVLGCPSDGLRGDVTADLQAVDEDVARASQNVGASECETQEQSDLTPTEV